MTIILPKLRRNGEFSKTLVVKPTIENVTSTPEQVRERFSRGRFAERATPEQVGGPIPLPEPFSLSPKRPAEMPLEHFKAAMQGVPVETQDEVTEGFRNASPWEKAISFVFHQEGHHLSAEKAQQLGDKGGETKFGISKRSYPHLDIGKLTLSDAVSIYKTDYWDKFQGDLLPAPVGFVMLDYAVNSGTSWATQELRGSLGIGRKGGINDEVLEKLRKVDASAVTKDLLHKRALFIGMLSRKSPQFARGWMQRVADNAFFAGRIAKEHTQRNAAAQEKALGAFAADTSGGGS